MAGHYADRVFSEPGRCWRFISSPDGTGRPDFYPQSVRVGWDHKAQGRAAHPRVKLRKAPRRGREAGTSRGEVVITLGEWQVVRPVRIHAEA